MKENDLLEIATYIPKDTILMLSGVTCVGKTTTAYEIVKNYLEFRGVSECDLIRTIVRTIYKHLSEEVYVDKDELVIKYNTFLEFIPSLLNITLRFDFTVLSAIKSCSAISLLDILFAASFATSISRFVSPNL